MRRQKNTWQYKEDEDKGNKRLWIIAIRMQREGMINKSGESKGAADEVFQEILSDTIIREGEINKGIP